MNQSPKKRTNIYVTVYACNMQTVVFGFAFGFYQLLWAQGLSPWNSLLHFLLCNFLPFVKKKGSILFIYKGQRRITPFIYMTNGCWKSAWCNTGPSSYRAFGVPAVSINWAEEATGGSSTVEGGWPWLWVWLCHLAAVWSWARNLTSLSQSPHT